MTGLIFASGVGTDIATNHFSLASTLVDGSFPLPGVLPAFAESQAGREVLVWNARILGAAGIGAGTVTNSH